MRYSGAVITGSDNALVVELFMDPSDEELAQLRASGATIMYQVVERIGDEVRRTWRYELSNRDIVVRSEFV